MTNNIDMAKSLLSPWDWSIFFAVLALTVAAVIWGHHRRNRLSSALSEKQDNELTFLDYLLMGRQLTLPLFIATLVATWYGGIFGVTQIAFESGIYNFITQGFFWYIAYLLFAFLLVPKIARYEAVTLPDLVGRMFGPRSKRVSGFLNILNVIPVAYVISMGLFVNILFGIDLFWATILGTGFVILYTLFGGFRAIVFSDLVQFFVMCSSVAIVLIFSITTFGGPDFLIAKLPATHFSPTGQYTVAQTLVWGLIALATLVDPNFYQRCFAARSPRVARNGIILSTIVWFCFDICTTAGGMYARAVLPQANSEQAYLIYALQLLPDGLRGFFLAGILATILSTIDAFIFVGSSTIAYDLMPERHRNKKWIHQLSMLFVAAIAIVLANSFQGSIRSAWKTLGSYSAACLLLPMMLGHLFPKKISDSQFCFACFLGIIATTGWRHSERSGFWSDVDELYIGILATSLGLLSWFLVTQVRMRMQKQNV